MAATNKEQELIDVLFLERHNLTTARLDLETKEDREQHAISLINSGVDVNKVIDDWRPLQLAVHQNCSIEVIQAIISAGADLNAHEKFYDEMYDTNDYAEWVSSPPLHIAIAFGFTDIVKTLITAGADVNMRAKGGNEFNSLGALDFYAFGLEYCEQEDAEEIRSLLLAAGAKE